MNLSFKCLFLLLFVPSLAFGFASEELQDILDKKVAEDLNYGNSIYTSQQRQLFMESMKYDVYFVAAKLVKPGMNSTQTSIWIQFVNGPDNPYEGFTPEKLKEIYEGYARLFVAEGYAKQKYYNDVFKPKYQQLIDLYNDDQAYAQALDRPDPLPDLDPKDFWWPKYRDVFNEYIDAFQADPQTCAGQNVLKGFRRCCGNKSNPSSPNLLALPFVKKSNVNCSAANAQCSDHKQCCSGICYREKDTDVGTCANPSLKRVGQQCTQDSECLSQICDKTNESGDGVCAAMEQCYLLANLDQACVDSQPYCGRGNCYSIDKGSLGGGSCIKTSLACSQNSDCCSDKCTNSICVENSLCKNCKESGQIPTTTHPCCPGLYKNSETGKCRHIYNPVSPICIEPGGPCGEGKECCKGTCGGNNKCSSYIKFKEIFKKKEKTSILNKILISAFNIIFPSAHAGGFSCPDGTVLTTSQIDRLTSMQNECNNIPVNSQEDRDDKDRCELALESQINAFCEDSSSNAQLSPENQKIIDEMKQQCANKHIPNSPEMSACLADVAIKEKELLQEQANNSVSNRFDDYIKNHNAPTLTDKTYSDVYSCEFRTLNDSWRAAGNAERNAELFLASFEFVFSGEGTTDYWAESGEKSVFERAQKVARGIRKERSGFVRLTNEIDRKSNCYCLLVFGVETFSTDKQNYFNNYCSDIAAQFANDARTNDQKDNGNKSAIDGSSINSSNTEIVNRAKTETIDKGALGISYAKALTKYLDFIAEADLQRFTDFEEYEEDLMKMSQYLIGTDFKEVWKPKLNTQYGVVENGNSDQKGNGEYHKLYKWGRRYMSGFWSYFPLTLLGTAIFNPSAFVWTNGGESRQNSPAHSANALNAAYGDNWPEVKDYKEKGRERWNIFMRYDGYVRHYLGPRFTNQESAMDSKRCRVKAAASACFKAAYDFNPGTLKYIEGLPETGHYLIDPKRPPFVDSKTVAINHMPNYPGETWTQIINKAVNDGLEFLDKTYPNAVGELRVKDRKWPETTKAASSYRNRNFMDEAITKHKHFIPKKGQMNYKLFDDTMKQEIEKAAKKYALCKDLKAPNQHDQREATERAQAIIAQMQANGVAVPSSILGQLTQNMFELIKGVKGEPDSDCYEDGAVAGDYGHGFLFESEKEADEWAEYTYEMHYVYSSLSKNAFMGYPLMGQNVYFEAVFGKMKLLRSMWAQRAINNLGVRDLYQEDLDKREGAYKSLGEVTNGTNSRNIKAGYGKDFQNLFKTLNFSGTSDIEAFNKAVSAGKASGKFNSQELAALESAGRGAARTNKKLREIAAFEKDTSTLASAKANLGGNDLFNKLASPIQAIAAANPGGAIASGPLADHLKDISNKLSSIQANQRRKKRKAYTSPFSGNLNLPSYRASTPSTSPDVSSSTTPSTGMSNDEAQRLIRQLNKDKNLNERNSADTLFSIVSKAYKRNYARVLLRNKKVVNESGKDAVSDKEKESIKKLLEN